MPVMAEPEAGSVLPLWRDPVAPWLIIHHRPMEGARARIGLRRLGFDVHWPREVVRTRWHDDVLKPYLPGYMFALMERGRASWSDLPMKVPQVLSVVGVREFGKPAHPPRGFVRGLIARCGDAIDGIIPAREDVEVERIARCYQQGDVVRISAGPMEGLEAVVSADRGDRVVVMLRLLGIERPVALPKGATEPPRGRG